MAEITLQVNNIKCGGCVSTIEEAIGKLPGVSSVQASAQDGMVKIQGDELERATICRTLAELGYPER